MGQAKRELERWEDLKIDLAQIAIGTGALLHNYHDDDDELVRAEDTEAERHAYARATIQQRRGLLSGTRKEVCEAMKERLDEAS